MYSRQTCFLSVPHRRPRLDPEVTRKQDSDCFNSCHSFQSHHISVLYVLAIISISLKQWMNNQIPTAPSGWVLGSNETKPSHLRWHPWWAGPWGAAWGAGGHLEAGRSRAWSGNGTWGATHILFVLLPPVTRTIQTGGHQQTSYGLSMRAHSGYLCL